MKMKGEAMTVGARIAECRKNKKISQESIAEALNVSRQTVSKWETDQAVPDTYNMIMLSKFFGVSVEYIACGEAGAKVDMSPSAADAEDEKGAFYAEQQAEEREQTERRMFRGFVILSIGLMLLIRHLCNDPNVLEILIYGLICSFGIYIMARKNRD
jgi:transcriptional regulator with XRE-family HTH domain